MRLLQTNLLRSDAKAGSDRDEEVTELLDNLALEGCEQPFLDGRDQAHADPLLCALDQLLKLTHISIKLVGINENLCSELIHEVVS